jgi:hypothetical protein
MGLFKRLLGTASRPRAAGRTFRPVLESLEARDVPSGGPWFGGGHGPALFGPVFAGGGGRGRFGDRGEAGRGSSTLAASLTGTGGASGTVAVSSNPFSGQESLSVHVSGLTADTTYTVSSGSTTLGTFTTNADGQGRLNVRDLSTALAAGDAITVADPSGSTVLSGTLAATHLVATLGGTGGGDGLASYQANVAAGQNSLQVILFGLSAHSAYSVQLGGTTVGTVTTNANGRGVLSVSNLATPPAAGSVLTVLDSGGATVLQGSFAAGGFGFFGGGPHGL